MVENTNIVEIKVLVDCHGVGDNSPKGSEGSGSSETEQYDFNDHGKVGQDLSKYINHEDFDEKLKDIIEDHGEPGDDKESKSTKAGNGIGHWITLNPPKRTKVNKKWEEVIKHWKKKTLVYDTNDFDSFLKENRRFVEFLGDDDDIALATEVEMEDYFYDKRAVEIWFYLDTSGSCIKYKDRFFHASQTLDKNKFKIRLFSFDTQIKEVDLSKKNVYGGGGTSFSIIEDHILQLSNGSYPDNVFVITDGHGDVVTPKHPERWHWFLTETPGSGYYGNNTRLIPTDSKTHVLSDFESV